MVISFLPRTVNDSSCRKAQAFHIYKLECFLIIIAVAEIFNVISKLGEKNKVIGNKGDEDLTAIFADTLCFAYTFLFVRIIFQMIKRAEQKDNIK